MKTLWWRFKSALAIGRFCYRSLSRGENISVQSSPPIDDGYVVVRGCVFLNTPISEGPSTWLH